MTMGIEFAVSGTGSQGAGAGIFGRTTSSLNSFAAVFGAQLEGTTVAESNHSVLSAASSVELDSFGPESPELDSNGRGLSGTGLHGSFGGKQSAKAASGKNISQSDSSLSVSAVSASVASSVANLPSTLLPPAPIPNVPQENVPQEQVPLGLGLPPAALAGNPVMSGNASSLNFAGEFFSDPARSSISSSPILKTGPSTTAAVTVPSVSSLSGTLTAIHGGDLAAPPLATGTAVDIEPQATTTGTLPTENNVTQAALESAQDASASEPISSSSMQQPKSASVTLQNPQQPTATVTAVQPAQGVWPSVAEIALNEVPVSETDLSSSFLGLPDSGARSETAQRSVIGGTASTLSYTLPDASAPGAIPSSASDATAPVNAAAVKASSPTITAPGVGATTAPATVSGIPMQGAPVKAVFLGTVAPQETPRASALVGSLPKSGGATSTDLSAAIQTHVANTLAGSSLELRASATLAIGQSVDGMQPKASPSALSIAVPATNSQFAKSSPAAAASTNSNGGTASGSNSSTGNSSANHSVANLVTGKDSEASSPNATVSPSDGQANQGTAIAIQTGAQASSPQATATALAVPVTQSSAGQPAPATAPARSANENLPSGASNSPSNPAAPGELPAAAAVGPVQVAQIASKAAQSEMRIGMNTSAFGSVEVRTTVHANDVGVVIGSEKGDLRSLLSNELPGIANALQQQNIRLNQVSFQQGAAFSGNSFTGNSSSGNGSQQNPFSSPHIGNYAGLSAEMVDDSPLAIESADGRSTSLSILA
jgi:hypothetical protein